MKLTDYSQPTPLVAKALASAKPGRVLDIGSHNGRNALYLAGLGWEVVAIDSDKAVLAELQRAAKAKSLRITTEATDVRAFTPSGPFDAILCLMVLHFLPEPDIGPTIDRMKGWTNPGGVNIVTAFTAENPPKTRPYLFPTGSLRKYYEDWGVKEYEETLSSWTIPEDKTNPERYMVARLVANRPS